MILQALKEYYDRKAADADSGIAPQGFERKEIPFIVVIKPNGDFVQIEDTREQVGKRLFGKIYVVPRSFTRTGSRSYEKVFLLWDHIGYLFGYSSETDQNAVEKAANQHEAWLKSLDALPESLKEDEGVAAMLKFYIGGGVERVKAHPSWVECTKRLSCNMTFKLAGDMLPVPCRPKVQEFVRSSLRIEPDADEEEGKKEVVAR